MVVVAGVGQGKAKEEEEEEEEEEGEHCERCVAWVFFSSWVWCSAGFFFCGGSLE